MRKFLVPKSTMPVTRRSSGRAATVKVEISEDELSLPTTNGTIHKTEDDEEEQKEQEESQEDEPEDHVAKKESPAKKSGMSAFERRRLENIAANQALLKDLSKTASKILPAAKLTSNSASKTARPRSTPRKREAPVKREPAIPTRRSSRVAGLKPEEDDAKRKLDDIGTFESPLERAKRMRLSGDLNLGDTLVEGKKWSAGLDGLQSLKGLSRGAQPGIRTFTEEDIENTTDKDLKDLRLRMDSLKLYEKWMPNGMLDSLSLFPSLLHQRLTSMPSPSYQDHAAARILPRLPPDRR